MTQIGTIELIASIDTSKYKKGVKDIDGENDKLETSTENSSKKMSGSLSSAAKVGFGALIGAAVAAGAAIISNVDNAVKRIDTLSNSTRTFENLGFRTQDVTDAMKALEQSIQGLPTSLDQGVRGVQLLAASTQDIAKSQKIFSAINNAVIGFGGNAEDVSGVIRQFSQALAGGKIDAETYNSLLDNGLGPTLIAIGKILGRNSKQLKDDLSEGKVTIDQFNDALIRLNTEGGGGMKSLQQIAKDSTAGISTSFDNANTAVTRGIAAVINAVGSQNIANAISSIGSALENTLKNVVPIIKFIADNKDIFLPIAVGIGIITGAFIAWGAAILTVSAAQAVLNAVLSANPIGLIVIAIAAVVGALAYFFTQTELGKKIVEVVFKAIAGFINDLVKTVQTVSSNISSFFNDVGNNIRTVFESVVGFVTEFINSIISIFNGVVNFFKEWGTTILAVIFFPFAILLGLIFKFKNEIIGFFTAIYKGIVSVVTPIVDFFNQIIANIYSGIIAVFTPVVKFFSDVFNYAWYAITVAFGVAQSYFNDRWKDIMAVFSVVGKFFSDVFNTAWNNIKSIFSVVGGFFAGVWNTIVGIFGGVGTAVGNSIGNAFKSVINSVLKNAVNIINGFIDAINGAIGIVNNIPGVKIGKLGKLPIPQLAQGGIVTSSTLAMIGEGREPEAVIPLSKLDNMLSGNSGGGGSNVTVNLSLSGVMTSSKADERAVANRMGKLINETLKSKGVPQIEGL